MKKEKSKSDFESSLCLARKKLKAAASEFRIRRAVRVAQGVRKLKKGKTK